MRARFAWRCLRAPGAVRYAVGSAGIDDNIVLIHSGGERLAVADAIAKELESIRTTFDDDKGAALYRSLVVAGGADSGAIAASSSTDPGNFYFEYFPNGLLREVLAQKPKAAPQQYIVHLAHDDKGHAILIDEEKHPEIVLPEHPFVDPMVLALVEGAPVTSTAAGNSFFNPFLWDGVLLDH